ncbi:hypothetical protein [Clostridium psychrophilum]|uniref:hypothetical protein n=1 Tax=Clostridium psychrophilum TaxID=132926 RepID=UPI001C0D5F66|nr:hypothetical protein [Clostridium psychrophilum]MBU3179947.1 hypothetical protein [Clostridium psychrophilum]
MRNISLKTKIITGLLTGGIYFSSIGTTFAATVKPLNINGKTPLTNEYKQISTKLQPILKPKVKNQVFTNSLTKDQASKIKAVLNSNKVTPKTSTKVTTTITEKKNKTYIDNKIKHINPLIALIDNGTITETQAEKILMKQLYLYHVRLAKSIV